MIFQPFIEPNLGHVSYIIADKNEAVIIDPRRDIDEYIEFLTKNNLNLKYIINTHTHADYIGGHLELVDIYPSVKNIFQKDVPAKFDFIKVKEGDIFKIGDLKLKILETPGHTPFCISCLVNENKIDKYIFTGDFLFVGDIGRPDLLGNEKLEELVELSYESANKLWKLKDYIIVFTSHIEGSLCGKNLSSNYFSTIGIEKQTNNSFKLSVNKKDYINNLLSQKIETPNFFKKMAFININAPKLLKYLPNVKYLSYKDFIKQVDNKCCIIDLRHPEQFKSGFIQNSINIYWKANIPLILGSLVDIDNKLLLVGDNSINYQYVIRQVRNIGFDKEIFILNENINNLSDLNINTNNNIIDKIIILNNDISVSNKNSEYIKMSEILEFDFDKNFVYDVKCKNGYKSMAIKSYLMKKNIKVSP